MTCTLCVTSEVNLPELLHMPDLAQLSHSWGWFEKPHTRMKSESPMLAGEQRMLGPYQHLSKNLALKVLVCLTDP